MTNVSVFGLGYVGTVTAVALARLGAKVIGVDINPGKVADLNNGESPVSEPGLAELLSEVVGRGMLRATTDVSEAIANSDVSMVCVGTPSKPNGSLNSDYVVRVAQSIASALRAKKKYHLIVIRSTVLPGTTDFIADLISDTLASRPGGVPFGICMNPEFLREGNALRDFFESPQTIIGEIDETSGDLLADLYRDLSAPVVRTDLRTAEMLKYANNAFHALKISFANEMGTICNELAIDGGRVMELLCSDTKLNISNAYLRPGFVFGGSCLPKDLRALNYLSLHNDLSTPLIGSILPSNEAHLQRAILHIENLGTKKIGLLGLTFKPNTDDLRESPMVRLAEILLGKGYDIQIYDPKLQPSRLVGSNRQYVCERIPHLSKLLVRSEAELLENCDAIIVGSNAPEFKRLLAKTKPDQVVCDFANLRPVLKAELV
jgi:GDP-mannose 6-dehydrogenase